MMRQRIDNPEEPEEAKISDFLIDEEVMNLKKWTLKVMTALKNNLFDTYIVRGIGKINMKMCNDVANNLADWITVLNVNVVKPDPCYLTRDVKERLKI